jgi:hypothetical protein
MNIRVWERVRAGNRAARQRGDILSSFFIDAFEIS